MRRPIPIECGWDKKVEASFQHTKRAISLALRPESVICLFSYIYVTGHPIQTGLPATFALPAIPVPADTCH